MEEKTLTKEIYNTKRLELLAQAQTHIEANEIDKANEVTASIEALDLEFDNACKAQANLNALNKTGATSTTNSIIKENGNKMENSKATWANKAEMFNSVEYRNAFMKNVLAGEAIPAQFKNTDAQTVTSEVSSVIPTVLVQKIYSKLETYGKFFAMATKTSYKGGVSVPTSSVNLTASFVAERNTASAQEAPTGTVTFAYRKLICKVAISFEADVVTLDIFEADLIEKVSKAMIKAIEQAMFTGAGADGNQPVGFLTETPASGQAIEIAEGSHFTYAKLCEAEAAVPEAYDANAVWVMPKATFYNEIAGMVDSTTGQPIARVNFGLDGKIEPTINGRRVEFSPYMASFTTTTSADTIVAAIFDFSSYVINTNYAMTIKKYTDEATDDQITKALMLVDGKTVDKNSLVTVTIKNS